MHLSGEIFRNSIANASPDDIKTFFTIFKDIVTTIESSPEFLQSAKAVLKGSPSDHEWHTPYGLNDHLYATSVPTVVLDIDNDNIAKKRNKDITRQELRYYYVLAFQVVRLVGLLHDLGHPPFSHVTESAILELAKYVAANIKGEIKRRSEAQCFLSAIQALSVGGMENARLHEDLGRDLIGLLLDEVAERMTAEIASPGAPAFINAHGLFHIAHFSWLVRAIVIQTLDYSDTQHTLLAALHRIVDGDLDSDRLDYVVRDLCASGIYKDTIQYSRLLSSYRLVFPASDGGQMPAFLPSTRALSTIEDFFWQRMFLYRYVIFHHRVAKMDGLMREALIELGKRYFRKQSPFGKDLKPHVIGRVLPMYITSLWSVLTAKSGHYDEFVDKYSQWDDSLLFGILRNTYFSSPDAIDGSLGMQVKELLSNQPKYRSLIKRSDDFLDVDEAFVNAVVFHNDEVRVESPVTVRHPGVEEIRRVWHLLVRDIQEYNTIQTEKRQLIQKEGLFANRLLALLPKAGIAEHTFLEAMTGQLDAEWRDGAASFSVLLVRKRPKTGVTDQRILAGADISVLSEISPFVQNLERDAAVFPPFFVYIPILPGDGRSDKEYRQAIGRALYQQFKQLTGIDGYGKDI